MNVLLVYPEFPTTFWSLKHAVRIAGRRALLPPLGLLTVAALLPRSWNLKLVDMNIDPLTDQDIEWADYVLLSAMLVQSQSAQEVAKRCLRLGKPLLCGGPITSGWSGPTQFFPHVVVGEAEELMSQIVDDMQRNCLKAVYRAEGFPDIRKSPIPRWDLARLDSYTTLAVQFSRGCPFDCEFCDITVLNGRVPRTKTPEQLISELEVLRQCGWDGPVFLVDDNFIGNKRQVKELLVKLIDWRKRVRTNMTFLTEASINLAKDDQLINLMVEAGFKRVFIGIESPLPESLKECGKVQNTKADLLHAVRKLQHKGLEVMAGFIVGFDSDPPEIFDLQFEFIQKSGIATAMVGLLTALPNTRLYKRLAQEGRLLQESTGNNTEAALNFIPKLDANYLLNGYRQLMKRLYEPRLFYERLHSFLSQYKPRGPSVRLTLQDVKAFLRAVWVLGIVDEGKRYFWKLIIKALKYPSKFPQLISQAVMGYHYRLVAQSL